MSVQAVTVGRIVHVEVQGSDDVTRCHAALVKLVDDGWFYVAIFDPFSDEITSAGYRLDGDGWHWPERV